AAVGLLRVRTAVRYLESYCEQQPRNEDQISPPDIPDIIGPYFALRHGDRIAGHPPGAAIRGCPPVTRSVVVAVAAADHHRFYRGALHCLLGGKPVLSRHQVPGGSSSYVCDLLHSGPVRCFSGGKMARRPASKSDRAATGGSEREHRTRISSRYGVDCLQRHNRSFFVLG